MTESHRPRLIQIANGDWIDPSDVRQVLTFDRSERNPDRVSIVFADGSRIILGYESPEDAVAVRDQIAGLVNEAAAREP